MKDSTFCVFTIATQSPRGEGMVRGTLIQKEGNVDSLPKVV
jgi:hypothetical protein